MSNIFVLYSCKSVEKPVSKLDQARQYLNQRDYDKATVLLRDLLIENPQSGEIKVLLSSSLSGSAGFDFTQSFPAFEQSIKMSAMNKGSPPSESNDSPNFIGNPDQSNLSLYLERTVTIAVQK